MIVLIWQETWRVTGSFCRLTSGAACNHKEGRPVDLVRDGRESWASERQTDAVQSTGLLSNDKDDNDQQGGAD